MKKLLIILLLVGTASAQPIPQPGLKVVTHDTTLTGAGTTALPLGLTQGCSSNQVLEWNGSAWICSTLGTGVTNSAGNHVIPVSDGTNLIASGENDDGTNLLTSRHVAIGGGGTFTYPLNITWTGTDSQAVVIEVDGTNIRPTSTNERQALNARITTTIDTTNGPVTSMPLQATVQSSRSAGSALLTNVAVLADAQNGDDNLSFHGLHGLLENDQGFALSASGAGKGQFGSVTPSTGQQIWEQLQSTSTTTQHWIQEDDTGHVGTGGINEAINVTLRNNVGFAMGSGGTATASNLDIATTVTKSSGTGTLNGIAINCSMQGADLNYCLYAQHGTIRADDGALFGATTIHGLTIDTGGLDITGTGQPVILGNDLSSFQVQNGISGTGPQVAIGETQNATSFGLVAKNTVSTSVDGIGYGLDTTVNASVRGGYLLFRGAGGGFSGSVEGGVAMAAGSGFPFVGMAANDLALFEEGGGDLYLGADNSTFVPALKIKSSDNSVSVLHGNLSVTTSSTSQTALFSTFRAASTDGNNLFIGGGGQSVAYDGTNSFSGSTNTGLGLGAGAGITTGYESIAIGTNAMFTGPFTGEGVVAIGNSSGIALTTGFDNVLVGDAAGKGMTTAGDDVAVGRSALQGDGITAVTGHHNTAVGVNAMGANATTAEDSVAVGLDSLQHVTTGFQNTCVGMESCALVSTNDSNAIVGSHAFENAVVGAVRNACVGANCLRDVTTGDHNTAVGRSSGGGITTGRANTIIGAETTGLSSSLSNNIILADGDGVIRFQSASNGAISYGNINAQNLLNGPVLQSLVIPSTAYSFGEVNREEVSGVVPAFPADLFVHVIRNSATADTTTHTQRSGGIAVEVTGSRSAGTNDMQNIAFECTAENAQVNNCIQALNGDVEVDAGNVFTLGSSNYFFEEGASGFIAAAGTIFAESNGTNAIDISATPTNAIKMRAATSQIDVDNTGASTLLFYNANSGNFTMEIAGPLDMQTHQIHNVVDPSSAQDAATKNYVDGHSASTSQQSPYYGDASDSTCAFDGVAGTVCGATLSGSTYTLQRDIAPNTMTVSSGVIVRENNFRVMVFGTLTGSGGGAAIINDGLAASGRSHGNCGGISSNYFAACSNGAGNGTNGPGNGTAAGANSAAINQWPTESTTAAGANGAGNGQGGGGGTGGTGTGGGGGAINPTGASAGLFTAVSGWSGKADNYGSAFGLYGTGGGGGGCTGGSCTGGGGGGGGGVVFLSTNQCAGTILVSALGGAGGAGALVGGSAAGGGGGGGGGVVTFVYSHRAAGCTTSVAGGTGGAGAGTGVAGGNGSSGTALTINISGDGS